MTNISSLLLEENFEIIKQKLKDIGVNVCDENGVIKDTYTIICEICEKIDVKEEDL